MSLEKRALFAFVLSMLLFLVYDYLYLSPKMKEQKSRQQAQIAAQDSSMRADSIANVAAQNITNNFNTESPESIPAPLRDSNEYLPSIRPDNAGTISVITPLYRVVLSKAGGEIRSVELFNYETDGLPVELLLQDSLEAGLGALRLLGENRIMTLTENHFEAFLSGVGNPLPDNYEVVLDESKRETEIIFQSTGADNRKISRGFRFTSDSYLITSDVQFAAAEFPFVRKISWGYGRGMTSTEKNQNDDFQNFQAYILLGEETHKRKMSDFSRNKVEKYTGMVNWGALQTKYFTTILIPEKPTSGDVELTGDKDSHYLTGAINFPAIDKRGVVHQEVSYYLGPLDYGILKAMNLGLERNISMGYKIFRPVSWVILWSLKGLYKFIPNYGLVIILLSVFTKVLFYRLTHKSFKSMRDMQSLQPKLQGLKEKYKDDKQKLSKETMRIYKEHGVNPLGGCLPLLLQMPVFIALFSVLKFTIEVRGAYFFGWITDLSQQDVLAQLPFALPLIGREISVLPLLMGLAMGLQTKIGGSMTPGSVSTQPKIINYMLPIVFTVIFYKMPSGLVLYWFINNILTIAQQYYINKNSTTENGDGVKGVKSTVAANNAKKK